MRHPPLSALLLLALVASSAGAGPRFVRNDGQWEARGRYALLGSAVRAWATTGGIVLDLPAGIGGRVVHVSLEGTSGAPVIRGEDEVVTKHHFFLGRDPAGWRTEVPGFARVRWSDVRPGVDLVVRGTRHGIEYELHLEPGADLDGFGFRFDGVDVVRRDAAALVLETPEGELRHSLPVAFVRGRPGGAREPLDARLQIRDGRTVTFEVEPAPPDRAWVLDPGIEWATYLGGSVPSADPLTIPDVGSAVEVDEDGTVVLAGYTGRIDFPTTSGAYAQSFLGGSRDVVICRLSADGGALLSSTYLGGSGFDESFDVALAPAGDLVVTGTTVSGDYPVTPGAVKSIVNSGLYSDAFVTRLDGQGGQILASTLLGGNDNDCTFGMSVDSIGFVTVTGGTRSLDFPVTAGAYDGSINAGFSDAFVTRISPDLTTLAYSTYLGGTAIDFASAVHVDDTGTATVVGETHSNDFPTTPGAYDPTGPQNAFKNSFVARFDPTGQAIFSSYLGGAGTETGRGVDVDPFGRPTVLGETASSDFPTTPGVWLPAQPFGTWGTVTRFDPSGSSLIWSTLVGGFAITPETIRLDGRGCAVLAAEAKSSANFPFPPGSFDTSVASTDVFLARFSPNGTTVEYATYVGGSKGDPVEPIGNGLALDEDDAAVIVGGTASPDYPVTPSAYSIQLNGLADIYAAKLDLLPAGTSRFGSATPGCAGPPTLTVTNMPQVGHRFGVASGRAAAGAPGLLLVAGAALSAPVDFSGAALWLDPASLLAALPVLADGEGRTLVEVQLPAIPALAGAQGFFQILLADACAPGGVAATPALDVTVQP